MKSVKKDSSILTTTMEEKEKTMRKEGKAIDPKKVPYKKVTEDEVRQIREKKEAYIIIREVVRYKQMEEEKQGKRSMEVKEKEDPKTMPPKKLDQDGPGQSDVDQTQLLTEDAGGSPFLVREDTKEKLLLDKPIFRIGKDRTFTDYKIQDNKTVSRRHVEIITKNNTCYIRDKNSKNGTYIDGIRLPAETEVEIKPGQELRVANITFLFYM